MGLPGHDQYYAPDPTTNVFGVQTALQSLDSVPDVDPDTVLAPVLNSLHLRPTGEILAHVSQFTTNVQAVIQYEQGPGLTVLLSANNSVCPSEGRGVVTSVQAPKVGRSSISTNGLAVVKGVCDGNGTGSYGFIATLPGLEVLLETTGPSEDNTALPSPTGTIGAYGGGPQLAHWASGDALYVRSDFGCLQSGCPPDYQAFTGTWRFREGSWTLVGPLTYDVTEDPNYFATRFVPLDGEHVALPSVDGERLVVRQVGGADTVIATRNDVLPDGRTFEGITRVVGLQERFDGNRLLFLGGWRVEDSGGATVYGQALLSAPIGGGALDVLMATGDVVEGEVVTSIEDASALGSGSVATVRYGSPYDTIVIDSSGAFTRVNTMGQAVHPRADDDEAATGGSLQVTADGFAIVGSQGSWFRIAGSSGPSIEVSTTLDGEPAWGGEATVTAVVEGEGFGLDNPVAYDLTIAFTPGVITPVWSGEGADPGCDLEPDPATGDTGQLICSGTLLSDEDDGSLQRTFAWTVQLPVADDGDGDGIEPLVIDSRVVANVSLIDEAQATFNVPVVPVADLAVTLEGDRALGCLRVQNLGPADATDAILVVDHSVPPSEAPGEGNPRIASTIDVGELVGTPGTFPASASVCVALSEMTWVADGPDGLPQGDLLAELTSDALDPMANNTLALDHQGTDLGVRVEGQLDGEPCFSVYNLGPVPALDVKLEVDFDHDSDSEFVPGQDGFDFTTARAAIDVGEVVCFGYDDELEEFVEGRAGLGRQPWVARAS